jgi:hypothetical protein
MYCMSWFRLCLDGEKNRGVKSHARAPLRRVLVCVGGGGRNLCNRWALVGAQDFIYNYAYMV